MSSRQLAAEHLADLKVQDAGVEAQRARVTAEAGPALYLAKLFGSDDTEAIVRFITALLVLVLDPLAVLLTLAATPRLLPPHKDLMGFGQAASATPIGSFYRLIAADRCKAFARTLSVFTVGIGG
jgi:hypothetical protein